MKSDYHRLADDLDELDERARLFVELLLLLLELFEEGQLLVRLVALLLHLLLFLHVVVELHLLADRRHLGFVFFQPLL